MLDAECWMPLEDTDLVIHSPLGPEVNELLQDTLCRTEKHVSRGGDPRPVRGADGDGACKAQATRQSISDWRGS